MSDAMVARLLEERAQKVALVTTVTEAANDAGRDLNDDDTETINRAKERVTKLDAQLETLGDNLELSSQAAERLARLQPGLTVPGPVQYRSAGEMLWDAIHSSQDRDASVRYGRFLKRAAEHMGTVAAGTTPVAGGVPGLLVDPTVGPIIDVFPTGRPLLSAIGVRPAPNSMTFHRPYLVDPTLADHSGVGPQSLEKAELVSKKFDVLRDDLALETIGGYLNVSQQLISFTAGGLDIIISELNRRYALATEAYALAELTNSTSKVTLSAAATASEILAAIYDASAMVYAQTGSLATWIAMGPQGWARLGSLVDAAGRPLLPSLGAANAFGTSNADQFVASVAGLRAIVTPAITGDTYWVGNSSALEFYEYRFPVLETIEASVLGRQIAVSGAVASYRPNPGNGAVLLAP